MGRATVLKHGQEPSPSRLSVQTGACFLLDLEGSLQRRYSRAPRQPATNALTPTFFSPPEVVGGRASARPRLASKLPAFAPGEAIRYATNNPQRTPLSKLGPQPRFTHMRVFLKSRMRQECIMRCSARRDPNPQFGILALNGQCA